MSLLLQTLATELERPRELPARVVNLLCGNYGVDRDALGAFLVDQLPKLEEDELDLALSPLFTPQLADQAIFAELLGTESVPPDRWPGLIQQLADRPTRGQLVTEDGQAHTVPLRPVTMERYVHRLRLEGTIPSTLFQLISHLAPANDRPLLKAVARRAVWENEARGLMLERFLTATAGREAYRLTDVVALLKLVESYRPADLTDLQTRLPRWQQALQHEIEVAASPKPFFNDRVQELHGGGRDQRRTDDARVNAKEGERAFLERLQQVLTG